MGVVADFVQTINKIGDGPPLELTSCRVAPGHSSSIREDAIEEVGITWLCMLNSQLDENGHCLMFYLQ